VERCASHLAGIIDTMSESVNGPFVEKFQCLGVIQDKSTGVDVYLDLSLLVLNVPNPSFQKSSR
jgi:hypothetical protein